MQASDTGLVGTGVGAGRTERAPHRRARTVVAGVSGFKRNAAAAIYAERSLAAVCQQERITRVREVGIEAGGFPTAALAAALGASGADEAGIAELVVAEGALEERCDGFRSRVRELDHHCAHAATAFLTSPFTEATVVVCDSDAAREVTVWRGRGSRLEPIDIAWRGPGFARVYSRLTTRLGLAPGSEPIAEALARVQPAADAGRAADLLHYAGGILSMSPGFDDYVERGRRGGLREMSVVAGSVQRRLGDLLIEFLREVARNSQARDLCLGGGLFFNTYLNTAVRQAGVFERVHIPVNPGNAGVSAGCALMRGYELDGRPERPSATSPFLGPEFSNEQIKAVLDNCKLSYAFLEDWQLVPQVVDALGRGKVVGWCRGRMEWGPRALGNRSILANPLAPYVLENLNRFLKQRPAYRTYGLVTSEEHIARFFDGPDRAPFMECEFTLRDGEPFSRICPAGSNRLRVQTISPDPSPLGQVLALFGQLTGVPVLVNTSFNGFHEPIVCSPRDAVRVFYGSGLDMAVVGNFLLRK